MDKLLFRRLIFIAVSVLLSIAVYGQQIEVTGTVTDATDGIPLPGVNVLVKNTFSGTNTGVDGKYAITVNPGDILQFSYIGYAKQEITIENAGVVNVSLELDVTAIDEVVTIGYGTARKEDATGSVIAVSSDDFNRGAIISPEELISGKIAGVQIVNGGGAPGEGATIRIRGGSSLIATNDPLIVIDGVPIDNSGISGMRSSLNSIHPNDIETFTVLKDASATAIYGSRASNGVIIITTKKGAGEGLVTVNYDGNVSFAVRSGEIDVLSADEFRTMINDRYATNPNATGLLGEANTDWQSQIYQTAVGHDHNLSFSGVASIMPYRVSLGYSNQEGILKTDLLERFTGTIRLSPTLLDDHLQINLNAKGMSINNNFANRGAIGSAVSFDPTQEIYDSESAYGGYFTWLQTNTTGYPNSLATANPVALLEQREDMSDAARFIGNVQVDYKLHMLPDLKFHLNLGIDKSKSEGHITVLEDVGWSFNSVDGGGLRSKYSQEKLNELLDFYLSYEKDITSINSRVNATAGYSWQHFYSEGKSYSTNYGGNLLNSANDYKGENYLVSFFGRVNYIMLDRYMLTVTLRQDGSSRFSPETRWGLFPAVALAWDMAKEPFLQNQIFNSLKLRLGWGVTGQQDIGSNYPYLPRYTLSTSTAQYLFGNQYYMTYRPEGYDANIKWEETTTYNAGIDFGIMNNRITGAVDVYYRETNDLLNFIPVPAGTNLTNMITTNVGDLINQGIEFSISGKAISKYEMFWEIGFNATYNMNEITNLTLTDDPEYIGVTTGGISGGVGNSIQINSVGYPSRSFWVQEQVYDSNGTPIEGLFVDRNEDGVVNDEDKYRYHKASPDWLFGFSSYFTYKGFDFSFSGRANIGNWVYNNRHSGTAFANLYNSSGYLQNVSSVINETGFENPKYFSDHFVHNASFMKLDNVSVGYQLGDLVPFVSAFRVYGTVQNVLTLTQYDGLDPEISNGIDNNFYPRPRTFMFGVSVEF